MGVKYKHGKYLRESIKDEISNNPRRDAGERIELLRKAYLLEAL
jgi:hypothetical protein